MRSTVLGVLLGIGLVWAFSAIGERSPAVCAERIAPLGVGPEGMTALASPAPDGGQQVIVVDSRSKAMGVYRVDAAGRIKLVGVRNVQWDLQMVQLNSESPSPQEIKTLLEQR